MLIGGFSILYEESLGLSIAVNATYKIKSIKNDQNSIFIINQSLSKNDKDYLINVE